MSVLDPTYRAFVLPDSSSTSFLVNIRKHEQHFLLSKHERNRYMMKSLSQYALLYEEQNIGPISQLAFSSRGLLVIGCKGAKMWDISSGKLPNDSLVAFDGAYMAAIALSPDGSRIAIGQENGVAIFDIATARRRQEHRHK
jgi:hypothetical protein